MDDVGVSPFLKSPSHGGTPFGPSSILDWDVPWNHPATGVPPWLWKPPNMWVSWSLEFIGIWRFRGIQTMGAVNETEKHRKTLWNMARWIPCSWMSYFLKRCFSIGHKLSEDQISAGWSGVVSPKPQNAICFCQLVGRISSVEPLDPTWYSKLVLNFFRRSVWSVHLDAHIWYVPMMRAFSSASFVYCMGEHYWCWWVTSFKFLTCFWSFNFSVSVSS